MQLYFSFARRRIFFYTKTAPFSPDNHRNPFANAYFFTTAYFTFRILRLPLKITSPKTSPGRLTSGYNTKKVLTSPACLIINGGQTRSLIFQKKREFLTDYSGTDSRRICGRNSVGRVRASQARSRGFESRCPLHFPHPFIGVAQFRRWLPARFFESKSPIISIGDFFSRT